MSGIYAADGSFNVTVVNGASYTGVMAADGSYNVVVAPGGTYVGAMHKCGAYYVTLTDSSKKGLRAPDGSLYVTTTPYILNGSSKVTAVSGSFSSITPPVLTLTSGPSDNQPDFTLTGDLVINDIVTISAYDDVGLTILESSGTGTVTSAGTLTVTNQLGPLTDGTKWYVARTARSGSGTSANSNVVTNTIAAFDAATTAWVNAVVADGGAVSATQKTRVNTLIVALKSASLFTIIDRLWLYGGESDPHQAKIDIINLQSNTLTNAPVLTAGGYTGNGSSSFINLNFNPSTAGGHFTTNSASFGCYVRGTNTGPAEMGVLDGVTQNRLFPSFGGSVAVFEINSNVQDTPASTSEPGLWHVVRTGSATTAYYKNGNSTPFSTGTTVSVAPVNLSFYQLAENSSGSAVNFSNNQNSAGFIGGGMNPTQAAAFASALNNYMTSWGIAVY